MATKIMPEHQAPDLTLSLVGGGEWSLSEQSPENFTMIVVYRGLHCPVCESYLRKLNDLVAPAAEAGVAVVATSMDDEVKATQAKADWELDMLDLAFGMTFQDVKNWGLYMSKSISEGESDYFAEPGLFWVRPDGRLYLVDISNMPWSRPDVAFLLSKVPFILEKSYPARGTSRV